MKTSMRTQYSEAIKLFATGITKKEISQIVGVTEKTLRTWFRLWAKEHIVTKETIENLKKRLHKVSSIELTPTQELKDLVYCIQQLERRK